MNSFATDNAFFQTKHNFPLVPETTMCLGYQTGLAVGRAMACLPRNTAYCKRDGNRSPAGDLAKLLLHKLFENNAHHSGPHIFRGESVAWLRTRLARTRTTEFNSLALLSKSKL